MKIWVMLSKLLGHLTSTSLFLAFNGALVVVFSFFMYEQPVVPEIVLAAFLLTFSVYGLNKTTDRVEDSVNSPHRASMVPRYYLVYSVAAMLGCLAIGALNGLRVFLILLIPLTVGLVYSIKVTKTLPRIKEIVGLKSFVVALSWALTGALLPDAFQSVALEKVLLVFAYVFVHLLVNTVIFDSLDVKGDKVSGVTTVPMVLGIRRTKILLATANTTLIFWIVYCISTGLFVSFMPALIFGVLYSYLMIEFLASRQRHRLRAELFLDGQWIPIVGLFFAIQFLL